MRRRLCRSTSFVTVAASLIACVLGGEVAADEVPPLAPGASLAQADRDEWRPEGFTTGASAAGDELRRAADEAVANLDVYPGLEARLFAAEPQMLSPTNIDVDHRGRIWVCEVVNYAAHGAANLRPKGDRILIFEDTDGDGQADTRKVYYQGHDVDSAMGICTLGNKVIVTRAPNILVFIDDDGDDKPDRKEVLFTRSGGQQNDHSLHSFAFGPDGRLYWNFGNAGWVVRDKSGKVVIDKAGHPVVDRRARRRFPELRELQSPYWGGMVFRCRLDGSDFEVLGHNFRNNYEAAVDSFGNVWQTDNDDDGNRGCRVNYVMERGNFGYLDELTGAGWRSTRTGQHEDVAHRHWHQNDPGVVPNFVHTGAGAPTGITVYEGRLLPELFWDQVISCDAGPGVVWAAIAQPDGAGFKGRMVNIVEGRRDRWHRPVDIAVAPDGALYVSDWYDPYVGWNRQGDVRRGRIFRIAPAGHVSSVPKFDFRTPEGAARALTNPNASARYLGWMALHRMQEEAEPALLRLFASSNPRYRARALWLLSKINGRQQRHIERALADNDPNIRLVALRAARQADVDVLSMVERLADDPAPPVLRDCAIAVRDIRSPEASELWARLALRYDGQDRWYLEALGIGAEGRWDSFLGAWLERVRDNWITPAGRNLIWRSRATVTPTYLAEILSREDLTQVEAARFLRAFDFQADSDVKAAALGRLALSSSIGNHDVHTRVSAEAILRWKGFDVRAHPEHQVALDRLLTRLRGTSLFARLVRHLELADEYPAWLQESVQDPTAPASIAAVRAIVDSGHLKVVERLLGGEDTRVAVNVARLLGNARAEQATGLLTEALLNDQLPPAVRIEAVRALVRAGEAEVLIDLAQAGEFPHGLQETAGRAIAATLNVALRDQAEKLFPMPPTKDNRSVPQMTDLLVYVGNPERGKEVFTMATCATCHKAEGQGVDFGPDLSGIGTKLTKRAIYEAVLNPASGIATGYEAVQIVMESGQVHTGLIVSETEKLLLLKLPGGAVVELEPDEIIDKSKRSTSAMPTGLLQLMTVDELIDLVEYLTTLKSQR